MLEVVKAEYQGEYKIWLEFNDGCSGIVDLANALWGPMFEPLKTPERFQHFTVSKLLHTLVWENDADLAPEYLYEQLLHQNASGPITQESKA